MKTSIVCVALTVALAAGTAGPERAEETGVATSSVTSVPWGLQGHEMAARAAYRSLPPSLPAFFRDAGEQLVYLNPEPDRWRDDAFAEMNEAMRYDHYIDLENVPEVARAARDRFVFLSMLYGAGQLEKPERDAGFLPFRIVEVYQRLVSEWRLWRAETDPRRRAWIEQRIVNDAGILGHYVTDGSQPHHTTIHFDGWAAGAPNPQGYTDERGFHARFEGAYVAVHVTQSHVDARMADPRSVAGSARRAVWSYLLETFAEVEELYRLDRDVGFDPFDSPDAEALDFTADRLAAGASMLATLWLSAWEESAGP